MDIADRRAEKIEDKLSDLISQAEEYIDQGVFPRSVTALKEGREGQVFHISHGQRKASEVLKQQTRGNRRGNGKKTI